MNIPAMTSMHASTLFIVDPILEFDKFCCFVQFMKQLVIFELLIMVKTFCINFNLELIL